MTPGAKSAVRLLDFPSISGYVKSMKENQAKRIALVVEGIAGLAQVILDAFMKDESAACEVVVKHDGVEALDYLLCRGTYAGKDSHVMPCVTLVDLVLPRSDGLGLLREMRDHEQTRRLPVVAFSSAGEHRQVDAAYACGANSYLGVRPGFEPFEESIRRVAHYWGIVNETPPPPL
jgi:two-component system, response regulator